MYKYSTHLTFDINMVKCQSQKLTEELQLELIYIVYIFGVSVLCLASFSCGYCIYYFVHSRESYTHIPQHHLQALGHGGSHESPQTSDIKRNLIGNKIADNSDVVAASPVGAARNTS